MKKGKALFESRGERAHPVGDRAKIMKRPLCHAEA